MMHDAEIPQSVRVLKEARPITSEEYDTLVAIVTNDFSKSDVLYGYDESGLGIVRMLTPIMCAPGRQITERRKGKYVKTGVLPGKTTVVQATYFAHWGNKFLVVTGYLTGSPENYLQKEKDFKLSLYRGIQSEWGLLKKQAKA